MKFAAAFLVLLATAPVASAQHAGHDSTKAQKDSAFHAMQDRGRVIMGVDQYTSVHKFEDLPDGGRIELQRAEDDTAGVNQIRRHFFEIAESIRRGDFRAPGLVHATTVPGVDIMMAKREALRVVLRNLPRGGEMRLSSEDPEVVKAIHEFLEFQRTEHRTEGTHQH
jgi:hypothetical protein